MRVNWKDKQLLEQTVKAAYCYRDVLKRLGLNTKGSNTLTLKKWITTHNIDVSHFNPYKYNLPNIHKKNSIDLDEIIAGKHPQYPTYHLKNRLLKEGIKQNVCEVCNLGDIWNDMPIKLQLDHINGDSTDHKIDNLQIICPNCHSQTPTFAGKQNRRIVDNGTKRIPQPRSKKRKYKNRQEYFAISQQKYKESQQSYVDALLNSSIDFSKIGWVKEAAEVINQKQQKVNTWMKRIMPEFYEEKCYKRKSKI